MRSNAMKTCAVGAMLFGGTLGATQTASAGVTWLDQAALNSVYVFNTTSFEPVGEAFNNGSAALSASQLSAGIFSASISATTATGFSMGLTVDSGGSGEAFFFQSKRYFTVADTVDFSLTAGLGNGYLAYDISKVDGDDFANVLDILFYGVTTEAGGVLQSGSLSAGTYLISVTLDAWADSDSGTFASFAVPAPGALALLGVAGLTGTRRRR